MQRNNKKGHKNIFEAQYTNANSHQYLRNNYRTYKPMNSPEIGMYDYPNLYELQMTNKEFVAQLINTGRSEEYVVDLLIDIMQKDINF